MYLTYRRMETHECILIFAAPDSLTSIRSANYMFMLLEEFRTKMNLHL